MTVNEALERIRDDAYVDHEGCIRIRVGVPDDRYLNDPYLNDYVNDVLQGLVDWKLEWRRLSEFL